MSDPWSHNAHYHPVVLSAAPAPCERALDVGCGKGLLVRRLAAVSGHVTGIDRSAAMVEAAREQCREVPNADFVEGDFLDHAFPYEAFDLVSAIASVHHMDFEAALTRMARLLRPGGALAVVGLAHDATPLDWATTVAILPVAVPVTQVRIRPHGRRRRPQGPVMPTIWPPPMSWGQVRRSAAHLLPGARYRRHVFWRYSLVWHKPT